MIATVSVYKDKYHSIKIKLYYILAFLALQSNLPYLGSMKPKSVRKTELSVRNAQCKTCTSTVVII